MYIFLLVLLQGLNALNPQTLRIPNVSLPNSPNSISLEIQKSVTYQLIEDKDMEYASCFQYHIANDQGEKVAVPEILNNALHCPFTLPLVQGNIVYFFDEEGLGLYSYNITNGEEKSLMSFYPDDSGITLMGFDPTGKRLAVVAVNYDREDYPTLTKLFVLHVKEGNLIDKNKYDIKINFVCGSANCSPSTRDLFWIDENTIGYTSYKDAPYDEEGITDGVETLELQPL